MTQDKRLGEIGWNLLHKHWNLQQAFGYMLADFADGRTELDTPELKTVVKASASTAVLFAEAWAQNNFPAVQLAGHKYAAALLSTPIPTTIDVRPPWSAFLLRLPNAALPLLRREPGGELAPDDVMSVAVAFREGLWFICAESSRGSTLNARAFSPSSLDDENADQKILDVSRDGTSPAWAREYNLRVSRLLQRLVLGVCLAMSNPTEVRSVGKGHALSESERRVLKGPLHRVFQVGHPVTVDCRQAVSDYLHGRSKKTLTVQFLVRGHWRNQAHGEGHAQRKVIWIEPFWKGPEDAPINVRPHVLDPKDDDDGDDDDDDDDDDAT